MHAVISQCGINFLGFYSILFDSILYMSQGVGWGRLVWLCTHGRLMDRCHSDAEQGFLLPEGKSQRKGPKNFFKTSLEFCTLFPSHAMQTSPTTPTPLHPLPYNFARLTHAPPHHSSVTHPSDSLENIACPGQYRNVT